MKGTVKFFNTEKGFGFARPDDRGSDVFVHIRQVTGADHLLEGDRIEFEMGTNERSGKPQAVSVRLLKQNGSDDPAANDPVASPRYGECFFERQNEIE